MTKIVDRIYLGNYMNAESEHFIINNNIGLVINMAKELNKPEWTTLKRHNQEPIYVKFPLEDLPSQNIIPVVFDVVALMEKFLQTSKKNILIHCRAGISRSASMVIAYLMMKTGMSYLQVYEFVRGKRPIVNPNPRFVKQLEKM